MTQPAPNLTTLSDTDLTEHLLAAEEDETAAKLAGKKIKNEMLNRVAVRLKSAYSEKPEPFGVVNLPFADKVMKIDTPKKVKWAQDKLEALWNQMKADNADPKQYIKIEYDVSETAFKGWGDNMKAYFIPARTVEAGNPSVKIVEGE